MYAKNPNNAPKGLRAWWASPPRTGMQRLISPWEYRHLRACAAARIAASTVLFACGILTLSLGGSTSKTYGWAALFVGFGALAFAHGYWDLTIARSASARN